MRTSAHQPGSAQKTESNVLAKHGQTLSGQGHGVHSLLPLRRTINNQALVQRVHLSDEEFQHEWVDTASPQGGHSFSQIPLLSPTIGAVQTKLTINTPGDKYEQEADRVADQVMQMPDPQLQRACACGGECPKCQTKQTGQGSHLVQTKSVQTNETGETAPPIVHEVLRSPGHPLDATTRSYFEPRFGQSFHHVRVHTEGNATVSAHSVGAKAYTVGNHIVFGSGQYAPRSSEGQRLLAHELTHVMQQGSQSGVGVPNSTNLYRTCLPAATCSASLHGCATGSGSASDFIANQENQEQGSRRRRRAMTTSRQRSTGHFGRARQLEIFLSHEAPSVHAGLHGVYIDQDMAPQTWGYVLDAPCSVDPLDPRQQVAGATGPCVFIRGQLNQEALQFNTTSAPVIGGQSREDWRIDTIAGFTHELQHTLFSPASVPTPAGVTCTRSGPVEDELSELNAILVEFHVVYQAVATNPDPAERTRLLNQWFNRAITNCHESLAGTLKKLRCLCNCSDVDAFVRETYNFVTSSWTPAERAMFNAEMHQPRWLPWDLRWPIP